MEGQHDSDTCTLELQLCEDKVVIGRRPASRATAEVGPQDCGGPGETALQKAGLP
jgi:hypothetical protein